MFGKVKSIYYSKPFFQAPIADAMAVVWEFFQPLLFGLIGAEVSIEYMDSTLIGRSWEHDFVNNAQILIILDHHLMPPSNIALLFSASSTISQRNSLEAYQI